MFAVFEGRGRATIHVVRNGASIKDVVEQRVVDRPATAKLTGTCSRHSLQVPMTSAQQLRGFIAKFSPQNQLLVRGLRSRLKRWLPGATELVYDNYNFLVIAYCPTEKTGDSYFSIGFDRHGANLFFGYTGARIDDPRKLLQGSGTSNRYVRLDSARKLEEPDVRALIDASIAISKPAPPGGGKLVIRSISAKQRPRR